MFDHSSETSASGAAAVQPHDLVSELLTGMRLFGVDYRRIRIDAPFGIRFGARGKAHFHFVARGQVLLRGDDGVVHPISAGGAVLLPRGIGHDLVSDSNIAACRDIAAFTGEPLCPRVDCVDAGRDGGGPAGGALIFTACMEFDLGGMHPLVALMPEMMFIDTLNDRHPELLPVLEAMAREAEGMRAGHGVILARLADVVAALIVRAWVECGCGDSKGWVEALRDPRLGRAISALHRDPGRNWTVAELAAEMGSSRSIFAERFLAVTGMTPLRYLTEVRMRLAAQWIGRDGIAIDQAAQRLGYGSQAAFSRAFKRIVGEAPGAARGKQDASRLATG